MSYGNGYGGSRGGGYEGGSGGYSNGYDKYSSHYSNGYSGAQDYPKSYSNGYDNLRFRSCCLSSLRASLLCTTAGNLATNQVLMHNRNPCLFDIYRASTNSFHLIVVATDILEVAVMATPMATRMEEAMEAADLMAGEALAVEVVVTRCLILELV